MRAPAAPLVALLIALAAFALPATAMVDENGDPYCPVQDGGNGTGEPVYCIMDAGASGRPTAEDFSGPGAMCMGLELRVLGESSVQLWWPPLAGVDGYQVVQQALGEAAVPLAPQLPPTANTTVLEGLAQGWWKFDVVAMVGGEAATSFCAIDYVPGPCHTGLVVRIQDDDAVLAMWPAVGNATYYRVDVAHNGEPYQTYFVDKNETLYLVTGDGIGTGNHTWTFTVFAQREAEGWLMFCPDTAPEGTEVPFFPTWQAMALGAAAVAAVGLVLVRRKA